ncbi:MAG: hypothetical protein KC466_08545 [Myxococcales bacterium]|nr:hypothetical protein [Myxococcales bacterium]
MNPSRPRPPARLALAASLLALAVGCAHTMPPPTEAPDLRAALEPPAEEACPRTDVDRTLEPVIEDWWRGRVTYEATATELARALAALAPFDPETVAGSPCIAMTLGVGRALALDLLAAAAGRANDASADVVMSRAEAVFTYRAAAERYADHPERFPEAVFEVLDTHLEKYPDDAAGRALFGGYWAEQIDTAKPWFAPRAPYEKARMERAWALVGGFSIDSDLEPALKARVLRTKALLANERDDHQAWVDAWADMKDALERIDAFDARVWNEGNGRIGEYWLRQGHPDVAVHMMCLVTEDYREADAPYAVGLAAGLLEKGDEPCARAYVRATVDPDTWREAELFALLATALYEGDRVLAERTWNRTWALHEDAEAQGRVSWYFERARDLQERLMPPPEPGKTMEPAEGKGTVGEAVP